MKKVLGGVLSVGLATSILLGGATPAQAAYPKKCDSWRGSDNSAQMRACLEFKGVGGNLYVRMNREMRVLSAAAGNEKRYLGDNGIQFLAASGSVWCNGPRYRSTRLSYIVARKGHPTTYRGAWIRLRAARHTGASANGRCVGSGNPHHGKIRMYWTRGTSIAAMVPRTRDVKFSVG